MAVGYLPPNPESWGRWPHHQPTGTHYDMMETGMVPYDTRTGTTAPIQVQRPGPAQPFLPGAFNPAPMPSSVSPQYQAPILCGGYVPYSPPQILHHFKPEPYLERQQLRAMPLTHGISQGVQRSWESLPSDERCPSPSIKSESDLSTPGSPTSDPPTPTKNIIPNVRVHGAPVHESKTPVDELVGIFQARFEVDSTEAGQADRRTCGGEKLTGTQQGRVKKNLKRFLCDIPGCSKKFLQKNNLDTHRRSHTGEAPFVCPYVECRERFTQGVNLKTHIRRHTGEKPYPCPQCGKAFPQRSNVKSHMKTHGKRELFLCKLDDCNKTFTAKGNLKTHQNAFHLETLITLSRKFATVSGDSITKEEKELIQYITSVHNNANKGIKGRGKGRKVKRIVLAQPYQQQQQQQPHQASSMPTATTSPANSSPVHPYSMVLLPHGLPQLHTSPPPPPQQQPMHSFHHGGLSSSPTAYSSSSSSMSRSPPHHSHNMLFGSNMGDAQGYGMMHDSDAASPAGSSSSSSSQVSTPVHEMHHHHHQQQLHHLHHQHHHQQQQQQMYDEDHERGLVFADRLY